MQFYEINICWGIIVSLYAVYKKDHDDKNCQSNQTKIASIIASVWIIFLPTVLQGKLSFIEFVILVHLPFPILYLYNDYKHVFKYMHRSRMTNDLKTHSKRHFLLLS